MRVLVTGGAGFIGSHLVDRLIVDGNYVTVVDNLSGGDINFISQHLKNPNFKFIKLDLRETDKLIKTIDKDIELVYHLAANADILRGIRDPSLDFEQTTKATFSLLQAMRRHNIKRLVFTSGSGVYGDLGTKYIPETYGPLAPVSMYGATKLSAEAMICAFSNYFDIQAWILRPANIIGPRATHGVVFDFIKRLKKKPTKLQILGDVEQNKAYLHVSDVVNALILVQKGKDKVNFYNLSSNSFITVNQIADLIIKMMKLKNIKITHTPGSIGWKGDVAVVRLTNSRIIKLGWQSHYTSHQAVEATIGALLIDKRMDAK